MKDAITITPAMAEFNLLVQKLDESSKFQFSRISNMTELSIRIGEKWGPPVLGTFIAVAEKAGYTFTPAWKQGIMRQIINQPHPNERTLL